jgi:hypothetical protein
MRITFNDGGYLEFQRSNKPYYVFVSIASRNVNNPLQLLVNSAEIKLSQLLDGVKAISGPITLEEKKEENE